MTVTVKKLFRGFASVRDYVVKDCIKNNEDLTIIHDGKEMLVKVSFLKSPMMNQIHKTKFKSKFNAGQTYELYDFRFDGGKTGWESV